MTLTTAKTKLGIVGATGRLGRTIHELVEKEWSNEFEITATVGRSDSPQTLLKCDVVIDASLPQAMAECARVLLQDSIRPLPAFVIGSTGWTDPQKAVLSKLAERTPVLVSTNFSLGMQALLRILEQAHPLLKRLGYEPTLVEKHHTHKLDAPSGTALTIQTTLQNSLPGPLVPIESIREGEIVGDHELTYSGKADRISFKHSAHDRSLFARGALQIAQWLAQSREAGTIPAQGWVETQTFFDSLSS